MHFSTTCGFARWGSNPAETAQCKLGNYYPVGTLVEVAADAKPTARYVQAFLLLFELHIFNNCSV